MFSALINEENISKFKSNTPFVIRASNFPDISWQTVLEILNYDMLNGRPTGSKMYKDYGFRLIEATRIPEVRLLADELYSVFAKSPHFEDLNEEKTEKIILNAKNDSKDNLTELICAE